MVTLSCDAQASHCGRIQALRCWASVVVVNGFSCPTACGIFPVRGSNPSPHICRWSLNHWTTREFQILKIQGSTNNILKLFQGFNRVILFSFRKVLWSFLNPGPLKTDFDKNKLADSDGMTTKDASSLGKHYSWMQRSSWPQRPFRGDLWVFSKFLTATLSCRFFGFYSNDCIKLCFSLLIFGKKNTKDYNL